MIPVEDAHLPVIALTDPGRGGKNNEDSYGVSAYQVSKDDPTPSLFAIVADGVGGHQAGEVAAEMAVEIISQVVADSGADNPQSILERAFAKANNAICTHSSSNSNLSGMSTTAACAWIIADRLYLASIGDSRIYLKRGENLIQLTVDHTWIQEAIESGLITADQARNHPNAHLIRRHLGSKQPAIPDFRLHLRGDESDGQAIANQGLQLLPGDHLLLCSDGLTDLVSDKEIEKSLEISPLDEALQSLIDLSNSRGGHDNITIIGIRTPPEIIIAAKPKKRLRLLVAALLVLFISAFLVMGWLYRGFLFGVGVSTPTVQPTETAALDLPLDTATVVPPTQVEQTPASTDIASPPVIASPSPGVDTPVPATYTPWPTSTTVP